MINFRYHIVSLAAMFLALAAGIALGAGPLKGADDPIKNQSSTTAHAGASTRAAGFDARYAKALGPRLLKGRLTGKTVTVFTLPGASQKDVDGIATDVKAAGGSIVGQIAFTKKLADPTTRQFATGVAQQSIDGVSGVNASDQSNYQVVGTALGRAFLFKTGSRATDSGSATITSAFTEAKLLRVTSKPKARADLALIVGSARTVKDGTGEVAGSLGTALNGVSSGAVIAAPAGTAQGSKVLAGVRDSDATKSISSVDASDIPSGRIVTVLALQAETKGTNGQWGTEGSKDGAMPAL